MALFSPCRGSVSSILHLPPQLRSAVFQAGAVRSFSATPSRKLTLVDIAIAGPTALINGIHSLGIPWYATIPITAAIVRGTFVYYFVTRPSRRITNIRAQLGPLAAARFRVDINTPEAQARYNDEFMWRGKAQAAQARSPFHMWLYQLSYKIPVAASIGKPFGAPLFQMRNLVNFGTLILITETIRLNCGSRQGLLSLLLGPLQETAHRTAPDIFAPAPVKETPPDPIEALAQKLEAAKEAHMAALETDVDGGQNLAQLGVDRNVYGELETGNEAVALAESTNLPGSVQGGQNALTSTIDSTWHTEGLSWCTDLTLPDPTYTLPCFLAFTMVATTLLRPTPTRTLPASTDSLERIRVGAFGLAAGGELPAASSAGATGVRNYFARLTFMQRVGVCVAGFFGVVTVHMPAAIVLYIISSVWAGWVQNRWIDLTAPIRPGIQPCTRQARVKLRRQFNDVKV